MSKKFSTTTADYLQWDEMINLISKLMKDNEYKMALLISLGSFWGLRISDILKLRWIDILDIDVITIKEKKTGKNRTIRINNNLKRLIIECYNNIKPLSSKSHILISQKNTVYTIQRINIKLKEIKIKYKLNIKNMSSHSLRKTFGREIYNQSSNNSEMALVKLMEIFNHSSIAITKRYLGIKQEELLQAYDLLSF